MARCYLVFLGLASCTLSSPAVPADSGPPGDAPGSGDAIVLDPPELPALGTPELIAELNADAASDDDATLTADRLTVLFNSNRGGNEDIWTSSRASVDSPWDPPEPVDELNSMLRESTTAMSADGRVVLLASDRDGDMDVYLATRPDLASPWSVPVAVSELNTASDEFASYLSADRLTVILHSDRDGDIDLYVARRASETEPFSTPEPIAGVNSDDDDNSGRFAAGGLVLTFHRSQMDLTADLYVATRAVATDPFGPATPIADLNTSQVEQDIWLSEDLCTLIFVRDDEPGGSSLYEAQCLDPP